jgi:diguanylate cyclase (GGDEF)-like protein
MSDFEIEHKAEFSTVEQVELLPRPTEGYRALADFLLAGLKYREDNEKLRGVLGVEKLARQNAEQLASLDELTGLKNRLAFNQSFEVTCKQMQTSNRACASFFLDIDGLKRVNDDCGHDVGDELLILAADRVRSILRAGDNLYRYGGDEFVVVAPNFTADNPEFDISEQLRRLQSIRNRFEQSINDAIKSANFIPKELYVGISVGAAILRPEETAADFLKRTQTDMSERKKNRRAELEAHGIRFGDARVIVDN